MLIWESLSINLFCWIQWSTLKMEVFVPENTMQPNVDPRLSLSFVSALWLSTTREAKERGPGIEAKCNVRNNIIWLYQLSWKCKLATVMSSRFVIIGRRVLFRSVVAQLTSYDEPASVQLFSCSLVVFSTRSVEARWLLRMPPDRAVRVRALAENNVMVLNSNFVKRKNGATQMKTSKLIFPACV